MRIAYSVPTVLNTGDERARPVFDVYRRLMATLSEPT